MKSTCDGLRRALKTWGMKHGEESDHVSHGDSPPRRLEILLMLFFRGRESRARLVLNSM